MTLHDSPVTLDQTMTADDDVLAPASHGPSVGAPKESGPPAYPSSAQRKVDWNKVGNKEEEEPSDANGFFNNLFKNSSDDVKRAMNKSMFESNGTVLSTDWNDIGSRKVETAPPDGVEAKKWES
jgi:suppressor of G2 allele of SKP1